MLAILAASACASPEGQRVAEAGGDTTPAAVAEERPDWPELRWQPHVAPVADYGRGVASLSREGDSSVRPIPRTDTLVLRQAPEPRARVVGYLLVRTDTAGSTDGWRYAVAAPSLAAANLVEYGYEEAGLPIDTASADAQWVRARFGTDAAGRWLQGWADATDARVEVRWWRTHLATQALFARDSSELQLATEPSGAALPRPGGSYMLHGTDSTVGTWLRVRLVTPSDYCVEVDSAARRERVVWVRFLDDAGRPLVWYHSRGC